MNITKSAAEAVIKKAVPGKVFAHKLDPDMPPEETQRILKEAVKEVTARNKRKQTVHLVLVTE